MKSIFTLLLLSLSAALYAGGNFSTPQPLCFVENKGQVTDQYGGPRADIQYKVAGRGMSLFIGPGGLHYQFFSRAARGKGDTAATNDTTAIPYNMYRLDMQLLGGNPAATLIAEEALPYTERYHTAVFRGGSVTAASFGRLTYKNVYPSIDWVLYIKDNKLEYDFVVHPGGRLSDIKLQYLGATSIDAGSGVVTAATPYGTVTGSGLYACLRETGRAVAVSTVLHGDTLSFRAAPCAGTLVIDPVLSWATYFGGSGSEEASGTVCDPSGNVFIGGFTTSVDNIATAGVHQVIYASQCDAYVVKFNSAGIKLWASYYGGERQDQGNAVACDGSGNVYLTGYTMSFTGIATPGAHNLVYGDGYDAFLSKFHGDGTLEWATYVGGGLFEKAHSVACDTTGNVYICGQTESTTGIATAGAFQDTIGFHSAYLIKFSAAGSVLWGTYWGADTLGNVAFACACDRSNNVYIAGMTTTGSILTTPGCYQDVGGGGRDAFVTKFDSAGHLSWSTYYGGARGEDIDAITCDDEGYVYITGTTFSTDHMTTPGCYQPVYAGGYYDAFLARLSPLGIMQWATYYGGNGLEVGQDISCDHMGHVYISGYTTSTTGIATPGSLHPALLGGGYDAFIARFATAEGSLQWATYFGSAKQDGAKGVACDNAGSVYLAGGGWEGIATPGSYQEYSTDSGDVFLAKFDTQAMAVSFIPRDISSLSLFPDPCNGSFTVAADYSGSAATAGLRIFNTVGRLLYQSDAAVVNHRIYKSVSLPALPSGIYILQLSAGGEAGSIKFSIR